jgi:16S rRNA (guanine1207-N2)-methyltransferase
MKNMSEYSYYQSHELNAKLKGVPIPFVSKPGLSDWDQITVATQLLAEVVNVTLGAKVMVVGVRQGVLAVVMAKQLTKENLYVMDTNIIALDMTERTLKMNAVHNVNIHRKPTLLPDYAGYFNVITIEIPKGRAVTRRLILEAHAALKIGGTLYLAGANDEGIQSIADDIKKVFENVSTLKYKKGNRAISANKISNEFEEANWTQEPGVKPGTWFEFDVTIDQNTNVHICSLPGVFSYDRIDNGTKLLLSTLSIPKNAKVLDVGCGYGVLGITAAIRGAGQVDMIDVNTIAIKSATQNIIINGTRNARVFPSDALYDVSQNKYDVVITNPPFHVGKAIDYTMAGAFIEGARKIINPGGSFVLVANKFLKYERILDTVFDKIERIADNGRYKVLRSS